MAMVFDDKIIETKMKLKYLRMQYLYKIFRETSHEMIFSKHFHLLDRLKFVIVNFIGRDERKELFLCRLMNDQVVRKFGFTRIE